jgi:hypothetical protein
MKILKFNEEESDEFDDDEFDARLYLEKIFKVQVNMDDEFITLSLRGNRSEYENKELDKDNLMPIIEEFNKYY